MDYRIGATACPAMTIGWSCRIDHSNHYFHSPNQGAGTSPCCQLHKQPRGERIDYARLTIFYLIALAILAMVLR